MMNKQLDFLVIIQARMTSTRLPGKVMMTVGGIPMVKRVWNAAKEAMKGLNAKVIVAWPERYTDLDENNVLERFRRISDEFPSKWIIRLTADCPLLTSKDIIDALWATKLSYYSNHIDGYDVQIFKSKLLWSFRWIDNEHVIHDPIKTHNTGLSVNTMEDLIRVRKIC